ncbi:MAG: hypothetical protein QM697_17620 [Lachnospiraceae bacterium]
MLQRNPPPKRRVLRGMRELLLNMAFEQCTEPGRIVILPCGKAATGPPVIAENEVRLQADEQKWHHGLCTRLLIREGGLFIL